MVFFVRITVNQSHLRPICKSTKFNPKIQRTIYLINFQQLRLHVPDFIRTVVKANRKVMKKILVMFTMMMVAMVTFAKDIKTVVFTTTPQMHCAACENKIKSNLRFEKGIKSIETSVPDQTVTVQYNADKTTPEKLQKGFEKFGYKARILKDGEKVEKNTGEKCDLM